MTKTRTLIALFAAIICAIPAIAIGYANKLDTNPYMLRISQKVDNVKPVAGKPITVEQGAAFVEPRVIDLPEVVIIGANRSAQPVATKDETAAENDGSSCFIQESLVGGWVRVCE